MDAKKNIVLVEDHVVIREGLKALIEKLGPFQIVNEFNDGQEFVQAWPMEVKPDLILLDFSMPRMNGMELMQWLEENKITIPVLMLTLETKENEMIRMFRLGLRGYIHKNCSAGELMNALKEIFRTGYYHNEFLSRALTSNATGSTTQYHEVLSEKMSDRELEFLQLVCDPGEYTYDKISEVMGVHRRTVDGYRESIFDKFEIKSKTGLVLFAIKNGLVDL